MQLFCYRAAAASPVLFLVAALALPASRVAAEWSYPACGFTIITNPSGADQEIAICLARNGDLWRGAAVHMGGASSYGAVSVWYAPRGGYCNNIEDASLVAVSNTEPLYTKTVTNDGYQSGGGTFCVIYRHQDFFDPWYNAVARFNDQLQLIEIFGDPDRD